GYQNKVSPYNYYYDYISTYKQFTQRHLHMLQAPVYEQSDSINYLMNLAIFNIFCEQIDVKKYTQSVETIPFQYNFDDPQGNRDFSSTFVTRLLATHHGNCRSFTYLYKILADEIGAKCWLALAPNHIYIRNYSKKVGWYNTELTSGTFPTDAWIAASGYVSADAIRNGIYMDTLSNQQSIGLCILDLAHGYIRQTNNYTDGFVIKCCDLVLQYHPVNPMALLLKGEVLKRLYLSQRKEQNTLVQDTYSKMQDVYAQLIQLGYREMPEKMYLKWLSSLIKEKSKSQEKSSHLK
ncbi:MAG TPA: hypothetical protein VEX63_12145, partial [Flavisolibacter sp.]|nr:hypothetical protein [Flavisolibacter sp.]